MLRQPLEAGQVTISRTHSTVTYPSRFILIAAMNPCPCGYLTSTSYYCTCSEKQIRAYQNRISGPILDRMDLSLYLQAVNLDINSSFLQENSEEIRLRVIKAREVQYSRYQQEITNSIVPLELIQKTTPLKLELQSILHKLSAQNKWSNRVHIKMIRLARTISDLKGEKNISNESLWEASSFKQDFFHKKKEPSLNKTYQIIRDGRGLIQLLHNYSDFK